MTSTREPIAIVGVGCRFAAGIDSPGQLWDFLLAGGETARELDNERWSWYSSGSWENSSVLRRIRWAGSFLEDIAGFDADFFGIAAREARLMDPQHRLTLEVAWQALEHAGIPARELAGTDTGVFVGIGSDDYGRRLLEDLPRIEPWTGIGASPCGAANRISHALDLRGPSVAVDTACSSSLVAIQQAMHSLWLGEVPLALAGGVLVMAAPGLSVVLDAAGATAPDGRCKSFDAAADGYGRGEGCGFVVLERLGAARRAGHRVLAVLRGGAVHQDGRTEGIMAPSESAQRHLLERAYWGSGIDPVTVDYVEAHGTGTVAGDPVEAAALAAVLGRGRPAARPCLIGSVKPNLGHLEAGAGVAGVIKATLALWHGLIPATKITTGPNPAIDWAGGGLALVTEVTGWPVTDHPRRAGVAGYGYGGTIAHLVLEQAPAGGGIPRPAPAGADRRVALYPVSGASVAGARAGAERLADWLAGNPAAALVDVGHTLALRRSHLPYRTAVLAADRTELLAGLAEPEITRAPPEGTGPVWVFSGHGSQWVGMGRELLAEEPRFAEAVDKLEAVYTDELGCSARQLLGTGDLGRVDLAQAAIVAVQLGLAQLWRHYGVQPSAVIGHSVGEIAAAVTAGVLDEVAGGRLACRRARLLRRVAGRGAMVVVPLAFEEVAEELAGDPELCAAIAAAPMSTVVSGTPAAVAAASIGWAARGLSVWRVDTDVAFHSAQMDPLCAELAAAGQRLCPSPARIPLYSTTLADPRSTTARDAAYWVRNLRGPVRFTQAIAAALADGHSGFLEVSAHPVVAHSIAETAPTVTVWSSLRRHQPQRRTLLATLGALYRDGVDIDWPAVHPGGALADLPTMAWQHRRYWAAGPSAATPAGHDPAGHTLLGDEPIPVLAGIPARCWRTRLDHANRPYPGEHPVRGVQIVPAAVLVHTLLRAAGTGALREVDLLVPVTTSPAREIQVVSQDGALRLSSRILHAADGADWQTHTTARVGELRAQPAGEPVWPVGEPTDPASVTGQLTALGISSMGFDWRVTELRRDTTGLAAQVSSTGTVSWAVVLDAVLSTASVVFSGPPVLRMPAHLDELVVGVDTPPVEVVLVVRVTGPDRVDVTVADPATGPVATLRGLRFGTLQEQQDEITGSLAYELAWRPFDPATTTPRTTAPAGAITVLGSRDLALALAQRGLTIGSGELVLWCADRPGAGEPVAEAAGRLATGLLAAVSAPGAGPLWCVTRGACTAHAAAGLAQTTLWGLGRIIAGERPDRWGGLVDLPADPAPADVDALASLLGGRYPAEDVLAIQHGRVHATRLAPTALSTPGSAARCRPEGTYLLTGGTGALGARVARWLVARGARRLILLSRTPGPPRGADRLRAELEAAGATVRRASADVADATAMAAAVDTEALELPPILGVVHTAGVTDNRFLDQVDEAALHAVLRPKVSGALVLHELFPPGSLDFFVLFSSAGHLLHLPGQAGYAAGNAFLDGLARHRRAAGDRGSQSLAWTSWRGLGLSTSSTAIDAELAAHGTGDITEAQALRTWDRLNTDGPATVVVLRVLPGRTGPPLLSELTSPAPQTDTDWLELAEPDRIVLLTDRVQAAAARALGADPEQLATDRPLSDLGLDSLLSVALRRDLAEQLGLVVPATVLWRHPTVAAIARYLATTNHPTPSSGTTQRCSR